MKLLTKLLFGILIISLGACSPSDNADSLNSEQSERYLIIGSYIAEIVVALGDADKVVAVSGGTDHIEELKGVSVIPGFRNTSAEAMLSVNPTAAFLAGRQTRPEIIKQLEDAGVTVHLFPDDIKNLDIVPKRIVELGGILNRQTEADALVNTFKTELKDALAFVSKTTTKPRGLFILSGGGRPTVVAGGDTHIALLIELAGAQNMTQDIVFYKPMSQEVMLEAAPEFILVNKEGLVKTGDVPIALTAPGVKLTPAAKTNSIFALPGGYIQGLGLNSPKAIKAIASQIHPELKQ